METSVQTKIGTDSNRLNASSWSTLIT